MSDPLKPHVPQPVSREPRLPAPWPAVRGLVGLLAALAVLGAAPTTTAADDDDDDAEELETRTLPDYDGRGGEPTTVGDVLVWVPRLLVAPLYLTHEFVVRRPLGYVIATAEEEEVPQKIVELFTFGDHGQGAVVPSALFDFGLRPSFGVYFRLNEFLHPINKLRVGAATGGPDWWSFALQERIEPDDGAFNLSLRGEITHRPDGLYYDVGSENDDNKKARYEYTRAETTLAYTAGFYRASEVHVFTGLRRMRFEADGCCDDFSIPERIAQGRLAGFPDGFGGYSVWRSGLTVAVDTRRERPSPGDGVRVRLDGEYAIDVVSPAERQFVKLGASVGGYLDLTGTNHVLSLTLVARMAEPIRGDVPFTELAELSDDIDVGEWPMRGFIDNRLLGRSAVAARLEYRWPVWVFLDGAAAIAMGNVLDPRFKNFDEDQLRMSIDLGLRTINDRDHSFDFLVGIGTEPISQGFDVESFRFVVGGSRAF